MKGHANFPGNDTANTISKWITTHAYFHLNLYLPTSTTIIHLQHTPTPGKVTSKHTKHLLPIHQHNNIHLSLSNDFFLHSSWFSRFIFKWVNGLYCYKGYAPHYHLFPDNCPLCPLQHPLDPTTFISECSSSNV